MIIEVSKYENFKMLVNFTVQKRENAKTRKLIFASQNFIVNFKKREFETQKNRFVAWGCELVNLPHEAGFKKIINFSYLPTLIF
jgi:hypothetical protein